MSAFNFLAALAILFSCAHAQSIRTLNGAISVEASGMHRNRARALIYEMFLFGSAAEVGPIMSPYTGNSNRGGAARERESGAWGAMRSHPCMHDKRFYNHSSHCQPR